MSKSIPLKEIVGFLPYGLQMQLKGNYPIKEGEDNIIEDYQILDIKRIERALRDANFKPLVRPLSYLTKEISHNGETFVPLKYLHQEVFNCEWPEFEIDFQTLDIMVNCPEEFYISFQDIQLMLEKLHEWHFDIYDWIKDGLAIDINTL